MANEKRIQIIKAADKRFAKHGLNKTTLDEIARDLRIGKATLYHYFKSKEDLFYQTISWEVEQYIQNVTSTLQNSEQQITNRLLDYISYKENLNQHSKLLYDMLVKVIDGYSLEEENKILNDLFRAEEELLKIVLTDFYHSKVVSVTPVLPTYILMLSWGMVFGNRLNKTAFQERVVNYKELILKSIESVLD
ncbi:MAG TPA: TetR/AcrR family transcriptional regulator [Ignavibacteriaceae bacterium]|nr:TetR/AcrR family transcriptional regulator [Ignavibacteriaceae bacterium]